MIKQIVFFNFFHNGDIHQSRQFIKSIISEVKVDKYIYSHSLSPEVLKDIQGLDYQNIEYVKKEGFNHNSESILKNNILYINTWAAQRSMKYGSCCLDTYCKIFNDVFVKNNIAFRFNDNINLVPRINYSFYKIDNIKNFFSDEVKGNILVCNGDVLSGQSQNFDFNPIIDDISSKYKEIRFFLTEDRGLKKSNVYYTRDIIGKEGCDLNENAFFSSFCDIIIGRSSGVFSFAINQENIGNITKKFICFSHNIDKEVWFCNDTYWKAKRLKSQDYNIENIKNIIIKEI